MNARRLGSWFVLGLHLGFVALFALIVGVIWVSFLFGLQFGLGTAAEDAGDGRWLFHVAQAIMLVFWSVIAVGFVVTVVEEFSRIMRIKP